MPETSRRRWPTSTRLHLRCRSPPSLPPGPPARRSTSTASPPPIRVSPRPRTRSSSKAPGERWSRSRARSDMLDIPVRLALPVLLVVGIRLGCLNHALLSALAISARGLRLAGWVANRIDPEMMASDANVAALVDRLPAPLCADFAWRTDSVHAFTVDRAVLRELGFDSRRRNSDATAMPSPWPGYRSVLTSRAFSAIARTQSRDA